MQFELRLLQLSVIAAELLGESRELAQARAPVLVAFFLEGEHFPHAEPAMLSGPAKRDAPLFQQTHEVLARDVQEIRGLLSRDFLADRHDRDGVAAGHDFSDALQYIEDGRRDRGRLAVRADQLALGSSALGRLDHVFHGTRQRRDLRLLVRWRRHGRHPTNLVFQRANDRAHGSLHSAAYDRPVANATQNDSTATTVSKLSPNSNAHAYGQLPAKWMRSTSAARMPGSGILRGAARAL